MKGAEASGLIVNIDIQDSNNFDLLKIYGVFRLLLWAGAAGKVRTPVGGPPRRSFLGEWVQDNRRDREVPLLVRMLVLNAVANEGRKTRFNERVSFALEFPNALKKPDDDFWASTLWKGFSQRYDMDKIGAKRGDVGSNLDRWEVETLEAVTTSPEGKWSQEFIGCMVDALLGWCGYKGKEATLCSLARRLMGAKEDREQWKSLMSLKNGNLMSNGTTSYRKDCRRCIQSAAGRPHRRTSHRSAYVLSIDVAGPFRDNVKDMSGSKFKFMLVVSYQFRMLPETASAPPTKDFEPGVEGDEMDGDVEDLVRELEQLFEEEGIKSSKQGEADGSRDESLPEPEEDKKKEEEEKLRREAEEASEPFEFSAAYLVRGMIGRKTGEALRGHLHRPESLGFSCGATSL